MDHVVGTGGLVVPMVLHRLLAMAEAKIEMPVVETRLEAVVALEECGRGEPSRADEPPAEHGEDRAGEGE